MKNEIIDRHRHYQVLAMKKKNDDEKKKNENLFFLHFFTPI
jgi:hypothetical protein